jgi:hypothetical protein
VVIEYHLDRWQDEKFYIGRREWILVNEQAYRASQVHGRLACLQALCAGDMTFFWTLRPGSLGPSFTEYEKQGEVSSILCTAHQRHHAHIAIVHAHR